LRLPGKLIDSNRSYFDFSAGVLFELRIPFVEVQAHDPDKLARVVTYFKKCIQTLREEVEQNNAIHE
jgi:hypothetical protein